MKNILLGFILQGILFVACAEFPDKPIQLVAPDPLHKKLVLVKDNIKLLQDIVGPVATVAVVGKFHSGKSFLMNQLMGKSKGFGVGPSIRPETMGIWMWGKPVTMTLKSGSRASIIFLDTEGFAANNVSENYDAKVFAVATLISSHLLYNSVKIIDQGDIDYLELLARRTQLFALHSQMSRAKWTDDLNHDLLTFPPLIWVVQDFVQSTEEGESPKQWLHRLMETHTREHEDYEISLLSIFNSVDCHTLFLPATKKKFLMDLSLASENDLTEEYKMERQELVDKIRSNIVPKEKNGQLLSGRELAGLLEILVSAANDGSLADLPSRWTVFVDRLQQSATEDCLKFYETEMAAFDAKHDGGPVNFNKLKSWHEQSFGKAMELLMHLLHGLDEAENESKVKLSQRIKLVHERAKDMNEKKIKLKCSELNNKLQLKAEELLTAISLPLSSEKLQLQIIETFNLIDNNFAAELENLVEPEQLTKHRKSLSGSIETLGQAYQLQNMKAIELVLKKGVEISFAKFSELTAWSEEEPRKPKFLSMVLKDAQQEANQLFTTHCKEYEQEGTFPAFQGLLQSEIAKGITRVHSENQVLFKSLAQEKMLQALQKFSRKTDSKHLPLPQNKTEIEDTLKFETTSAMNEFKESLEEFSTYSIYESTLSNLKVELDKRCAGRRQENVEAFTREVEQPLRTAKQIILLSSDSYNTVFGLRKYMIKVCLLQLNEGKPKYWSSELKSNIIDHYIKSEEGLQGALKSKEGLWSSFVGFFQWIVSWFYQA